MQLGNKKKIVSVGKQVSLNGEGEYKVISLKVNEYELEDKDGNIIKGNLFDSRLRVI